MEAYIRSRNIVGSRYFFSEIQYCREAFIASQCLFQLSPLDTNNIFQGLHQSLVNIISAFFRFPRIKIHCHHLFSKSTLEKGERLMIPSRRSPPINQRFFQKDKQQYYLRMKWQFFHFHECLLPKGTEEGYKSGKNCRTSYAQCSEHTPDRAILRIEERSCREGPIDL